LTGKSVEAGLAGTIEGAGGAGTVGGAVQAVAGDLNPSAVDAATTTGQSGKQGPPLKDPISAATNTDAPGGIGHVTIVITRPKIP
jgi:hypothetical protein